MTGGPVLMESRPPRRTRSGEYTTVPKAPVTKSGEFDALKRLKLSPFTRSFITAMHDLEKSLFVTNLAYDYYGGWSGIGKDRWARYASGERNEVGKKIPREDCEALGRFYQVTVPQMFGTQFDVSALAWATTETWLRLGGHDLDTFRSLIETCQRDPELVEFVAVLMKTQSPAWAASTNRFKFQAERLLEERMARRSKLRQLRALIESWQDEQQA